MLERRAMRGPFVRRLVVLALLGQLASACDGCRTGAGARDGSPTEGQGSSAVDGAAGELPSGDEGGEADLPESDAGGALGARADGGAPPCAGMEIDALAVLADPRCAITAREARRLRAVSDDAGAAAAFVQRATAGEDGVVTVRLTNAGTRTVTVPLLDHADLPAFTALAQDPSGTVLELAPPSFAVEEAAPSGDAGLLDGGMADGGPSRRARIAKAKVPRGGAVVVRIVPSPVVVRRVAPPCPPGGGACAPTRLVPGAYVLHLGQLLVDVEAGAPARVAFLFR